MVQSPSEKFPVQNPSDNIERPPCKSLPARIDRERRLLALLVTRSVLSQDEMEAALEAVQMEGVDLESLLLDTYHVAKSDFGAVLSEYFSCPFLAYDERAVLEVALLKNLRIEYLRK
ncbi:MAG: hypothetical protein H8J66_06920, partial [Nitrospira sp.]|nr:hypothetical protein [Nitrospira sp.]